MGKPAFDPNQPFDPVSASADKPPFDPNKPFQPAGEPMSIGKTAIIKGEEGATLGLRPVVAGAGAAAGAFSGTNGSLSDRFAASKQAFVDARHEANLEQNQASKDHPVIAAGSDLAGSALTLPFLPAKGVAGAIGLGAGLGAARAAGSAESLPEAAKDVAGGAVVGGAAYGVGKLIGKGAQAISNSKMGQSVGGFFAKTSGELTGVPDKEIEAYATRAEKINDIVSNNQAEGKFESQLAANHMKDNVLNDVSRTKSALNGQITAALENAPKDPVFPAGPIKDSLQKSIGKLDPVYDADQIQKINGIMGQIDQKSGLTGKLSVQDLQVTKKHLFDISSGAFDQNSRFFQSGDKVANAAKNAGGVANDILNAFGPPEIQNANRQLSQLHEIEDSMRANLLNKKASASALYSVGAGSNPQDTLALRQLGQVTGGNYLQDATDLSAARTFANPPVFPTFRNGRALLGPTIGGAVGGGVGALVGGPGGAVFGAKIGAGVGGAIASPATLKLAIDTGRISGRAIGTVANAFGINPQNLELVAQALKTPQAQEILLRTMMDENQAAAAQPRISTTIRPRNMLSK